MWFDAARRGGIVAAGSAIESAVKASRSEWRGEVVRRRIVPAALRSVDASEDELEEVPIDPFGATSIEFISFEKGERPGPRSRDD